jgi:hypothetical protein
MADTYSFTFGYEELLVLNRLLNIETLPGLPEQPFAGIAPEQVSSALAVAERSLRARGFIQVSLPNQPVNIYSPVLALFGACRIAQVITLVNVQIQEIPAVPRFYHTSEHLTVERSFPEIGLHRFTAAPTPADLEDSVREFLHLHDQPALPNLPSGSMPQATLEVCRNAPTPAIAQDLLQQQGVPTELAQPLAIALVQPVCVGMISALYTDSTHQPRINALVVDDTTIWLLNDKETSGQLQITSISATTALDRIWEMMQIPSVVG